MQVIGKDPFGGKTRGGLQTAFTPTGQVIEHAGQSATALTEQEEPFSAMK